MSLRHRLVNGSYLSSDSPLAGGVVFCKGSLGHTRFYVSLVVIVPMARVGIRRNLSEMHWHILSERTDLCRLLPFSVPRTDGLPA